MAARLIRCVVIQVPFDSGWQPSPSGKRPSEMIPWSDPYIAGLVRRCQREVAQERRQKLIDTLKFLPRTSPRDDESIIDELTSALNNTEASANGFEFSGDWDPAGESSPAATPNVTPDRRARRQDRWPADAATSHAARTRVRKPR